MFYLLLALPHILGICALLWIAYRAGTTPVGSSDTDDGNGGNGGQGPTPDPRPGRPGRPEGGLPLADAELPHRRLRVGEQLAELYPRPARRPRDPVVPERLPDRS